ncbi:hypothetical protein FG152_05630 [Ochrobactrum sp. XJ1]|nr:hypothetical protein [Ochrobactrum sp. XJ1]
MYESKATTGRSDPPVTLENDLIRAWSATSGTIAKLWLIFAVMYFFELASFPLSIDEELAAFRHLTPGSAAIWAQQGRWGAYLFERFVFPQPTLPFLPAALFGLGLVVAYVIFLESAGLKIGRLSFSQTVTFGIFCGYPTWVFIIEFYSNAAAVGFGVALSSIAIWILYQRHHRSLHWRIAAVMIAACAAAFAVSIYQSLLFLMLSFGIGVLIFRAIRADTREVDTTKDLLALGVCLILSFGIYKVLDRTFLSILGIEPEYVDQFLQLDALLTDPVAVVKNAVVHLQGIYGFKNHLYLTLIWSVPAILFLGAAGLASVVWNTPLTNKITILLLSSMLIVSPFVIDLVSKDLPTRSVVSAPFVIWCFAYLALHNRLSFVRLTSIMAISVGIFQFLVFSNSMSASSHFTGLSDQLLASRLYDRISMSSPTFSRDRKYDLVIYGGIEQKSIYPVPPSSTVGGSFFGWDGGNPKRIIPYLTILGFDNIQAGSLDTQSKYIDLMEDLPVWPAVGSVMIDDAASVVMVRLARTPSGSNLVAEKIRHKPIPIDSPEPTLFSLNINGIRVENASASWRSGRLNLSAGPDPMVFIDITDQKDEMAACRTIQVATRLFTSRTDRLQVFYQTPSDPSYNETRSKTITYSGRSESYVLLHSHDGFGTELRVDPGDGNTTYDIGALEVRCLD